MQYSFNKKSFKATDTLKLQNATHLSQVHIYVNKNSLADQKYLVKLEEGSGYHSGLSEIKGVDLSSGRLEATLMEQDLNGTSQRRHGETRLPTAGGDTEYWETCQGLSG